MKEMLNRYVRRKNCGKMGRAKAAAALFALLSLLSLCAFAPEDGEYSVSVELAGGSGKASVTSPTLLTVKDGVPVARIQWSSPNYDYMVVDGEKYLPIRTEGGSVFELPVSGLDEPMDVIGDTVAMSRPHEVEYTLTFQSGTIQEK